MFKKDLYFVKISSSNASRLLWLLFAFIKGSRASILKILERIIYKSLYSYLDEKKQLQA